MTFKKKVSYPEDVLFQRDFGTMPARSDSSGERLPEFASAGRWREYQSPVGWIALVSTMSMTVFCGALGLCMIPFVIVTP